MSEVQKKPILPITIHVILWGFIAAFPLIFLYSEGNRDFIRYIDFTLPLLVLMIVFYANYSFLISRFLFRKKLWQFFLVNVLLFAVCILLLQGIKLYVFEPYFQRMEVMKPFHPRGKAREILFFRDILSMSLVVGLAVAIRMTMQWYQSQAEQKELEKLHIESELNNLKHQLNPHFLFNTLNNIYSLISVNQDHAQDAVHQFSNLLRYVLYDSDRQKVPLARDLAFTSNYINLMSLRLPSHVILETEILPAPEGIAIAPLLFISLIENAFKHGVSPTDPSYIRIKINMPTDHELECSVENSNFRKEKSDKSGSGIGLANLKKRLELLYPTTHRFEMSGSETNFVATLHIQL